MKNKEEAEADKQRIKAFLKMVKSHPDYRIKTIYNGEKTYAIEKVTGIIWIITVFKGEYSLEFLTKKDGAAISELMQECITPIGGNNVG